jgi:tRNA modification GTPase
VLTGLPNAGKSTLFNRMTGMDRAIQSAVAGTTRDEITAPLALPGGDVMLCDTAGLDEGGALPGDAVLHRAGQSAAARAVATADLVLVIVDGAHEQGDVPERLRPMLAGQRFELILNKADLCENRSVCGKISYFARVSGRTGEGVAELLDRLDEALFAGQVGRGGEAITMSTRQIESLRDAQSALKRARQFCGTGAGGVMDSRELLALELRHAVHALSLLFGEITTEDILGRIFARFCIGK